MDPLEPKLDPNPNSELNKFDRGTDLTLFDTERQEDWVAIIIAFIIAAGIVFFIET